MSSTIDPLLEPALSNVSTSGRKNEAVKLWSEVAEVLGAITDAALADSAVSSPRSADGGADVGQLAVTCADLHDFLFGHALVVVEGEVTTNRYPVEFVSPSHLEQLVGYLRGPITATHVRNNLTWDKPQVAAFLEQWLTDTNLRIPDVSAGFLGNPLFVAAVEPSTSARAAEKEWSRRLEAIRQGLADSIRVAPAVSVAMESASRARSAAEKAETQAGGAATNTLAAHFESLAVDEKESARWWSGTAIASLVVSAVVALVVLVVGAQNDHEWVDQLLHLALTLPFVALSAYASAVGSRHRHQAWWAKTTAAQLHTVSPYVLPLNADDRSMVLSQLGVRVFGQPAFNTSAMRPETASVLAPVQSLLSRSPEKNSSE